MNNEPVAWMQHHYETEKVTKFSPVKVWEDDIPLYTHPATQDSEPQSCQEADGCPTEMAVLKRFWRSHQPAKTLTDEEIDKIMKQTSNWYEFARAILRKAQEK